jgi:hypothetical protein
MAIDLAPPTQQILLQLLLIVVHDGHPTLKTLKLVVLVVECVRHNLTRRGNRLLRLLLQGICVSLVLCLLLLVLPINLIHPWK